VTSNQSEKDQENLLGAGGNWQIIDEIIDPNVVRQENDLSCGPACAEMLLKDRGINISQTLIASLTGIPTDAKTLAQILNSLDPAQNRQWIGGPLTIPNATSSELLDTLNTTGTWAALLRQFRPLVKISHLVVVNGVDNTGNILIRDPWEGTRYKMKREVFLEHWTNEAIFALKL
jgi:ABC-type bacteriocin/lantibiotic exporter with double-glycine peptidase domain